MFFSWQSQPRKRSLGGKYMVKGFPDGEKIQTKWGDLGKNHYGRFVFVGQTSTTKGDRGARKSQLCGKLKSIVRLNGQIRKRGLAMT